MGGLGTKPRSQVSKSARIFLKNLAPMIIRPGRPSLFAGASWALPRSPIRCLDDASTRGGARRYTVPLTNDEVLDSNPTLVWGLYTENYEIKLNVDGSTASNPGQMGGGGVLSHRNHTGHILLAFSRSYGYGTSLEAEFRALSDGLQLCNQHQLFPRLIEVDSKLLADVLLGHAHCPWKLLHVKDQIKTLISANSQSIMHIYREGNAVADEIVLHGVSHIFTESNLPQKVLGLARLDALGVPSIRISKVA
ncbi:hypothetical protein ACH5RR_029195 [Cinchona calisaya]|uniref:RNase H type-1 domain-containing protein n=1 Tax=Cinchona calisaya TaxID=153742 RepID=A0ABD2YSM8_9GENT